MNAYPVNEIGALPNVGDFGSTFSYAAWTPGTTITLCNVPWNNDYRDIVRYASKAALNTYLNSGSRSGPRITIDKMTYCRLGVPIRVNLPFNACYQYNYLRVVNNAQPVTAHATSHANVSESGAQTLFYFITDVRYLAPNTTEISIQLDVWQTFHHDITFGNCYIERGHIGIANENGFDNYGRDYLTVPEGLDVGNEYLIKKTHELAVVDNDNPSLDMRVMVMSTTRLFAPYGTVDAPVLTMAAGSSYYGVPNACDLYVFDSREDFQLFMTFMDDKPWVTQGIVSVTAIDGNSIGTVVSESLAWVDGGPFVNRIISGGGDGSVIDLVVPELSASTLKDRKWLAQDWRTDLITGRYAVLKKFLTYPYCAVELTTYSGTPIVLKPECMYGSDIVVIQKSFMGQPSPRIVFIPYKYNAPNSAVDVVNDHGAIINDGGEMFDMMTGIFDLPTFSVVNNGYLSYMASNRNAIAFQHSTADWSQQRALGGAGAGMETATRSNMLGKDLAGIANESIVGNANLARTVAGQRALLGGANALVKGAASGTAAGAGAGILDIVNQGANLAIQQGQIDTQSAIASRQNQASAGAQQQAGLQNIDTNFQYAQYAAQGDYANSIAGINAKVQDAKLIQPTTTGQLGGDVFNLAMFKWGCFAKIKVLQSSVMATIGEYWLRYGYAVNRFGTMPADFACMEKFTYWKLRETYIASGAVPETYRQTIRGIFEKGVTVWSDADDIGMIDVADNDPLPDISL